MSRFKYPIGHPCYYEAPDPIPCESGCPEGQICDDETGFCVDDPNAEGTGGDANFGDDALTEAASLLDSFYDTDADPFDEVTSEEDLPYPNEQITFEENNIQFAARDKIVANQGCAYWIWSSPASRFVSEDVDETALGSYFNASWDRSSPTGHYWGFPGQSAIFQDPLNYYQARNYDPLRWSTGRVWAHRTTFIEDDGEVPVFRFPAPRSAQEHIHKYSLKFLDPPNSAGGVLYSDASGNYLDETIYIQFGGLLYSTLPSDIKFEFLGQLMSGGDYTDHTVTVKTIQLGDEESFPTGEVDPKSRKELIEGVYNDPEKVEESLLAKFFSNGAIGDYNIAARINNQPQIVPKTYMDFAHKTQMPFFDKEAKKMNISNGLSADILIHRNFFSKEFQSTSMGTSEDIFKIPNCYRHYRERKRPNKNCQIKIENQVDRILKFSAANIKEMNDVTEQYKKVYPVTAQIRFDTTQRNAVSDMFVRYGMDKYLLDQREKFISMEDARSPGVHKNSNLDRLGQGTGQLGGRGLDEFYYAYDIGGYSIFRVRTYAEYLNQISMKKNGEELGELEDYMKTNRRIGYAPIGSTPAQIDNRAFNISTEMRTAYLEDFLYQLKSNNEGASDQLYELFDDNMFPLGVLDTTVPGDDSPDHAVDSFNWRKIVNDFNREVFSAKISNLPYENITSDEPGSPTSFGKYNRTVKDIYNGKLAYSEVLGYSIEKYEHNESNEKKLVQKFYFFDSSDVTEINFLDNQLRYNKKYTYVIKAINCVFGTEYFYRLENEVKQVNASGEISAVENEDLNFIDEFLEGATRGDEEERDRRLAAALGSAEVQSGTGWSNIAIGVRARSKPRIAFIEVPYFKKTIHTVDLPPMPPQVEILPYKDNLSKVLVNLTPSAGEMEAIPRPLLDGDVSKIETMYAAQDVAVYRKGDKGPEFHPSAPIKFSGDSLPTEYQILILENPPEPPISIERFATAKIMNYGNLLAGNLHKDIQIRANVPNYISFRALDTAGVSMPSEVYYVELVSHQDGMYLVVEEYVIPEQTPELFKVVKNAIQIDPSNFQVAKGNSNSDPDMSKQPFSSHSVADPKSNIWDKEYRLNIKSRTTGREFNLDFSYSISAYTAPSLPADEGVGDEELDAILQACNRYSDLPQSITDSELYRAPEQINTGADDFVASCPTGLNMSAVKQHFFFEPTTGFDSNLANIGEEYEIERDKIIKRSVPLLLVPQLSSKSHRITTGAKTGQCGCPAGYVPLSSLKGFDDIDPNASGIKAGVATICIEQIKLCPAGSVPRITPFTNERGKQVGTIIHCACSAGKGPCGTGCYDPCPAMHIRDPATCVCKPNCPSPKVWTGEGCKCPGTMIEDPQGRCIQPRIEEPPVKQPELDLPNDKFDIQDKVGMYDTVLSPDEILELQRAGYINDQMRRMIQAGTVDAETILDLKDKLKLEGGGGIDPLPADMGREMAGDIGGGRAGALSGDDTVKVDDADGGAIGALQEANKTIDASGANTALRNAAQGTDNRIANAEANMRNLQGGRNFDY